MLYWIKQAQGTFTCCYIQYTLKWRILIFWDMTHIVPCLFWPHPVLVPKYPLVCSQSCLFHLVPITYCDILFYHEDVNIRHTPPETLHSISEGLVRLFQRNLVPSPLLGWLNHTEEGTIIVWNFKNYQTQWHRVISQDCIFSNTTMRTSILGRCTHSSKNKFLSHYVASHHRKRKLQSPVE